MTLSDRMSKKNTLKTATTINNSNRFDIINLFFL